MSTRLALATRRLAHSRLVLQFQTGLPCQRFAGIPYKSAPLRPHIRLQAHRATSHNLPYHPVSHPEAHQCVFSHLSLPGTGDVRSTRGIQRHQSRIRQLPSTLPVIEVYLMKLSV